MAATLKHFPGHGSVLEHQKPSIRARTDRALDLNLPPAGPAPTRMMATSAIPRSPGTAGYSSGGCAILRGEAFAAWCSATHRHGGSFRPAA
jgi:hypothetical protein